MPVQESKISAASIFFACNFCKSRNRVFQQQPTIGIPNAARTEIKCSSNLELRSVFSDFLLDQESLATVVSFLFESGGAMLDGGNKDMSADSTGKLSVARTNGGADKTADKTGEKSAGEAIVWVGCQWRG